MSTFYLFYGCRKRTEEVITTSSVLKPLYDITIYSPTKYTVPPEIANAITDTMNRRSLKHCLSVNILVVLPIVIYCGFTKLKQLFQHYNNERKLCLVHKKDIYL